MDSLLPGSLSVTSDLLVTLIYRLQGPGGTESEKGKQEFEVRRNLKAQHCSKGRSGNHDAPALQGIILIRMANRVGTWPVPLRPI